MALQYFHVPSWMMGGLPAPPQSSFHPFLRLPVELQTEIVSLATLLRNDDGTPQTLTVWDTREAHTHLFSIIKVNKELNLRFGTLALELHVFRLRVAVLGELKRVYAPRYSRERVRVFGRLPTDDYGMHTILPPRAARPHIKHLEVVVSEPRCISDEYYKGRCTQHHREPLPDSTRHEDDLIDWLQPVRELREMGFGHLKSLLISIDVASTSSRHTNPKRVNKLMEWVRGQVVGMDTAADKIRIGVVAVLQWLDYGIDV